MITSAKMFALRSIGISTPAASNSAGGGQKKVDSWPRGVVALYTFRRISSSNVFNQKIVREVGLVDDGSFDHGVSVGVVMENVLRSII
jgi:hypothetical protein